MNAPALASTRLQTQTIQGPHPLGRVMRWEMRRFSASRIFWVQALAFFAFLLFITWAQQKPEEFGLVSPNGGVAITGFVAGTSAWGLLDTLPTGLIPLVLLLPFITTDGVTRDLQRRTHELVMTTVVPSWAYVWGRYLIALLVSLGLALMMLAAIVGMGAILHLSESDYPSPSIGAAMLLWVDIVLPATILVASVGFALGTLFPNLSTPIKVVIMVVWILGALVIPSGLRHAVPPGWYVNWDPTSAVTAQGLLSQYSAQGLLSKSSSAAQFQNGFLAIENKVPALGTWFTSHLLLGGLGLILVLAASLAFKRSRDVLA